MPKKDFKLAIIIITYNSENTIEKCLKSIQTQNFPGKTIVIDNNSTDRTWKKLTRLNIVKVKNSTNTGFAKSVNQGIKLAIKNFKPSHFFILNPDAYLDKNCLKKIFQTLPTGRQVSQKNPEIGLITPKIKDAKTKKTIFTKGQINWLKMSTSHSSAKNAREDYLTGCCLLIKKAVLDKIGGFDERFFLYYEDADFSLRAKKAGFKIETVDDAICYHNESSSSDSKTKTYYLVKSGLIFFHKHFPWPIRIPYFWPIFWLRFFYHTLISKKELVAKGMKDFYYQK
jgi:hypothetical protein